MRTDKLMLNGDPKTIAACQRARRFKAAAAATLLFCFAVIAVTAPDSADSDNATTPSAVVQTAPESSRYSSHYGRGSDVDDESTSGVDMHG